jgi:anti-sigma regulatory factor (Ser/Thr protein kinase)
LTAGVVGGADFNDEAIAGRAARSRRGRTGLKSEIPEVPVTESERFELGGGLEAAGRARRALENLSGQIDPGLQDDLRLLITELVTNSVRHAGVDSGDVLTLNLRISAERLRAEVHDGGDPFEPVAVVPREATGHGWGLVLVDRIADRWGVEGEAGKYVWFEIDQPAGG